jgi:hypothetical protein
LIIPSDCGYVLSRYTLPSHSYMLRLQLRVLTHPMHMLVGDHMHVTKELRRAHNPWIRGDQCSRGGASAAMVNTLEPLVCLRDTSALLDRQAYRRRKEGCSRCMGKPGLLVGSLGKDGKRAALIASRIDDDTQIELRTSPKVS